MPSLEHIHTFAKYKKKPGYFKCLHPQCTYVQERELVVGKLSCCTVCGDKFMLNREAARRTNPRCLNCSNTREAQIKRTTDLVVRDIFNLPTEESSSTK